jgi:predicted transcriptional regulator
MEKQIKIGVADARTTAMDFIEAWKRAAAGKKVETEQRLNFENLETLLKALTTGRWMLLKVLRKKGPLSIRALAKELNRDYKNVHTDVRRLEALGLIERTEDGKVAVPWDTVEARLRLAA